MLAWSLAGLLALPLQASAFESDVHFGLTLWLARQAGYTPEQAATIALGDQRVDSGDVQFTDLLSLYACNAKDAAAADAVRSHHFPSAKNVPNAPADRGVEAGGAAARRLVDEVVRAAPGRESYLLFKWGEAIHVLQDSWSNQGVPDVPASPSLACDPSLAWAAPAARGGWASHQPDLTARWSGDTIAMAAATYEALGRYPQAANPPRLAKPWSAIAPELDGFVRATTKSGKADWFAAHGITDVSFLDGTSLPDGARPFVGTWRGRKMPPLPALASGQHGVDPALLLFFDAFLSRWLSGTDSVAIATEFGATAATAAGRRGIAPATRQLAARLTLWRVRDHGSVAELAHQRADLSARQLASLDAAGRKAGALVQPSSPAQGLLTLLPNTAEPSPLLPYWTHVLAAADGAAERAVATVKLRHAPYDAIAVLAEKTKDGWKVVSIDATVEH